MAGPSLAALARILVNEGGLAQELAETPTARELQAVRNDLARHVNAAAKGGNLGLIIATEKAIVDGDLKRYANSPEMTKSLGAALTELAAIERHLELVADPAQYRTVNEAHSLPKNRRWWPAIRRSPAGDGITLHAPWQHGQVSAHGGRKSGDRGTQGRLESRAETIRNDAGQSARQHAAYQAP